MRKVIEGAITEAKLLDMPRITLSLEDAEGIISKIEALGRIRSDLSERNEQLQIENHELRAENFSLNKQA
jgi:hypothetical protein